MIMLENFISADEYARLCGVSRATVLHRVKNKNVSAISLGIHHFIDIRLSPPKKRVNYHKKHLIPPAVWPLPIPKKDLVTVKAYARGKNQRAARYYEAIILGHLEGIIIGGTIFINRKDPFLG